MKISQIKLYENDDGHYKVVIDHNGGVAASDWCEYAPEAYSAAEDKLIFKPGYVQKIPRVEYVT